MKPIFLQAWANLRSRKLQTALIFLTLAASALLIAIALTAYFSGYRVYDRLMQRTHGAHIWLEVDPAKVPAADLLRTLKENPEVTETTPAMPTLYIFFSTASGKKTDVKVRDLPQGSTIARLIVVSGREPKPKSDEILVDANLARSFGIGLGDQVRLLTGNRTSVFKVVGTFVSSEFCAFPDCNPPTAYLGPGTLAAMMKAQKDEHSSLTVGVRIRHPEKAEAVYKSIQDVFPQSALAGYTWLLIHKFVGFFVRLQALFMLAFAIMAALVGGFLIANAISGAIRAQTRQIGLLRAIGFTNSQLAEVYLSEYIGIGVVASLVGIGPSIPLSTLLFKSLNQRYDAGTVVPPAWALAATVVAILALVVVAALLPLRRIGRLDTVTAIRRGSEPPHRRRVHLPELPVAVASGLTSVMATPSRSLLTILGLAVVALAVTVALSLYATVREFVTDPIGMGLMPAANVSLRITDSHLPSAKVEEALKSDDRVQRFSCEAQSTVRVQGETRDLYPRFVCGDVNIYANMLLRGRLPKTNDEATAAYTIAHQHGWKISDRITLLVRGKPYAVRIVGIYRDMNNLGQMFILPLALLNEKPMGFYVDLKPEADSHAYLRDLQARFGDAIQGEVVTDMMKSENGGTDVGMVLSVTVLVLALLLSLIAAFGVLSSMSMSVHEDRRAIGILKAIGMTPGQVALSVVTAAVVMAAAGYVIGAPLGIMAARALFNALGEMVGTGPIQMPVYALGELLLLPAILAVAALGAYLPARRAGRLSVVMVLREE